MHTIFDSHLHIIDPRFPLIENQGFLPEPFTCTDYLSQMQDVELVGGAVVSGSFQAFDQTYLIDSLQQLGSSFVGVTQLPSDTSDGELIRLHEHGVRAIRFNVKRGGSEDISQLEYFAKRVYELVGWHAELYIDSKALADLSPIITKLPAVSIDHLGLSEEGFTSLLHLVDQGVRVKATGFGRVELNVVDAIQAIYTVNPDALMFGTDLPSTRAKRPYHPSDIDFIYETLDRQQAEKVLYTNALAWYTKR